MERTTVKSSALVAYAYDPAEATLEIVYSPSKKTGQCSVYRYTPVAQAQVDEWLASPSLGTALNALRIAPGVSSVKVGEEPAPAETAVSA